LQRVLRSLQATAQSFGKRDVAEFVASHSDATERLDFLGLSTLDDLAALLSDPGTHGERLEDHLRQLAGGRELTTSIGAGFGNDEPSGDAAAIPLLETVPVLETAPAQPSSAPTPAAAEILDQTSAALIDSSIAALDTLAATPFSEPVAIPEDSVVPIESLLYRGRSALDRAVEIRDELRKAAANDPTALEELFDLLELARAE
jgi:hypothetical protein